MPEHWQETTLGEVGEVNPKEAPLAEDAPFVPMDAVNVGQRWVEYTEPRGTRSGARARAGDVLFARITPCLENGKTAQVQSEIDRCGGSTEFIVLRGTERLDADFLYFWATDRNVRERAANLMTGSTGRQRLSPKDLAAMTLSVPPLSEQRRIVDLVGSIDTYIDSLETQIETTRTARIALTTALLDSLDGTPTKSLAEIEDEGLVELGRGKVISKKTMSSNPGDFPVYSSAAQNDGMIGSYNEYMFDEELITWSVDGGGHLFHRRRHKFSVTNIGGYLRILDPTKLRYGYLCAVLQGLHSRCHFDWQHKAHPSVIRYEYSKIPIPEMAQQQEIEQTIEAIDEQVSCLESQVESVRALRSGVLSELLSGERLLDESYDVAVGL